MFTNLYSDSRIFERFNKLLYAFCTKHEISLALQRDTAVITTLVFENYKIVY